MDSCKKCAYGHDRSKFSFKKYGAYHCTVECSLIENERTPYRRPDECCSKFKEKMEENNENG